MTANGGTIIITASFSSDAGCNRTAALGLAPANCSPNVPAPGIPTMSEWGLILFALIIFTLSVVFGTQHQRSLAMPNGRQSAEGIRQRWPFDRSVYFRILPIVYLLIGLVFTVAILLFGYELTNADIPGSLIAGAIITYLAHFVKLSSDKE